MGASKCILSNSKQDLSYLCISARCPLSKHLCLGLTVVMLAGDTNNNTKRLFKNRLKVCLKTHWTRRLVVCWALCYTSTMCMACPCVKSCTTISPPLHRCYSEEVMYFALLPRRPAGTST